MHEKTLLYGTLLVTCLAATVGVWRDHARSESRIGADAFGDGDGDDAARPPPADTSPIQLTASDGSGLRLASLTAHAAIEDPLALTELRLTFENPEPRVREGTFRIVLPQGASLSRFAMKVGDAWQEGEVVEKQAARRAYEDSLHRKQDPALMEQGAGNEFTARVFPIPAGGTKELVLAYSEVLSIGEPYTIPIKGLPSVGAIDIDVHVSGGAKPSELHEKQITPAADFVIPANAVQRSPGQRSEELVVARVVPFTAARPRPVAGAVVLVDTSASRGLGLKDEAELVGGVLGKLGSAPVEVAAFDQEVAPIYEGPASGFGAGGVSRIVERGALGASNFERALEWAGSRARSGKKSRVVLVTDGVATAGETDAQRLRSKVEAFRAAGVSRLDVVAVGGLRDDALLRTVVRGVLDEDGTVLDGKLGPETIARHLGEATSSGVSVTVAGADWWYPKHLDGLQSGDEAVVFARMKDDKTPVRITVGDAAPIEPALRVAERPLLERAVARAEIQSLLESPLEGPEATAKKIVELSTRFRVLSPHTAMLVLETDSDYARFKIDRAAKLDILTVDDGKIRIVQAERGISKTALAGDPGAPKPSEPPPPPRDVEPSPEPGPRADEPPPPTIGALGGAPGAGTGDLRLGASTSLNGTRGGGLAGLGGIGGGGDSAGAAAGAAAGHESRVAGPRGDARTGGTTSTVPVADADRVVAAMRARFRQCYQTGLASDPSMMGRIVITAKIVPNGAVESAEVSANTGLSPAVGHCLAGVAKRAQFSAPGGTGSTLTIPIIFEQQGAGTVPPGPPPPSPFPTHANTTATATATTPAEPAPVKPYEGRFKVVMDVLASHRRARALLLARQWESQSPGDVLALVALGEALEATGDLANAARAYGSILELFPSRADSRRFAGERLERLALPAARELAIDTYAKAAEQRPDHPASHRLHAFALLKDRQYEAAFAAIRAGVQRSYAPGRFPGVDQILKEDAGLIAAAWKAAEPGRAAAIDDMAKQAGAAAEGGPSLRFVLVWETDANDVDFHIHDGQGGHAYYQQRKLPSGGELYADITTGYGPECFTIRGKPEGRAYPYTLQAHYYSRGPMGYGMGKLQIIEHDGAGHLTFDERPFVVMVDRAFVDLGAVRKP